MRNNRLFTLLLCSVLAAGMITGCSGKQDTAAASETTETEASSDETAAASSDDTAASETNDTETDSAAALEAAETEMTGEYPDGTQDGPLKPYNYDGDDLYTDICIEACLTVHNPDDEADLVLPVPVIVKVDDSDPANTKILANLWAYDYKLDDDSKIAELGGEEYPCLITADCTPGKCEITDIEGYTEGTKLDDLLNKICNNDEALKEELEDQDTMQELKKDTEYNYTFQIDKMYEFK